jgi:hypothetical protein
VTESRTVAGTIQAGTNTGIATPGPANCLPGLSASLKNELSAALGGTQILRIKILPIDETAKLQARCSTLRPGSWDFAYCTTNITCCRTLLFSPTVSTMG